jgi:hypothetical protein
MAEQFSLPEENGRLTQEGVEQIDEQEELAIDQIFQLGKAALQQSEFESDSAYDEVFRDAPNPTCELTVGDRKQYRLTSRDTTVYEYPHYPEFDHIYHASKDGDRTKTLYLWKGRHPEAYRAVKEQGFDIAQLNRPTEFDYKLWINSQLDGSGLSI